MVDECLDQLIGEGNVIEAQDGKVIFNLLRLVEGLGIVDDETVRLGWVFLSTVIFSQYTHVFFGIHRMEELNIFA